MEGRGVFWDGWGEMEGRGARGEVGGKVVRGSSFSGGGGARVVLGSERGGETVRVESGGGERSHDLEGEEGVRVGDVSNLGKRIEGVF